VLSGQVWSSLVMQRRNDAPRRLSDFFFDRTFRGGRWEVGGGGWSVVGDDGWRVR